MVGLHSREVIRSESSSSYYNKVSRCRTIEQMVIAVEHAERALQNKYKHKLVRPKLHVGQSENICHLDNQRSSVSKLNELTNHQRNTQEKNLNVLSEHLCTLTLKAPLVDAQELQVRNVLESVLSKLDHMAENITLVGCHSRHPWKNFTKTNPP